MTHEIEAESVDLYCLAHVSTESMSSFSIMLCSGCRVRTATRVSDVPVTVEPVIVAGTILLEHGVVVLSCRVRMVVDDIHHGAKDRCCSVPAPSGGTR